MELYGYLRTLSVLPLACSAPARSLSGSSVWIPRWATRFETLLSLKNDSLGIITRNTKNLLKWILSSEKKNRVPEIIWRPRRI